MGIDIGTGCAGVGIFDSHGGLHGRLISHAVESIEIWKPKAKSAHKSLLARDELSKCFNIEVFVCGN
ncbi:MAG: hypothetical protein ACJZ9B_05265 [Coraliomargaritaceae bacterium]